MFSRNYFLYITSRGTTPSFLIKSLAAIYQSLIGGSVLPDSYLTNARRKADLCRQEGAFQEKTLAYLGQAEAEGLPEVFRAAGFEWRLAGCSMCLAMNPDKLVGRQLCASSSNRNFKGRQGSPTGRTLLMSPAMVAAAALRGTVADVREVL